MVDVPGVDVRRPAVLGVPLVMEVDPASQITLSREEKLWFKLLSDHCGSGDAKSRKNESKTDNCRLERKNVNN